MISIEVKKTGFKSCCGLWAFVLLIAGCNSAISEYPPTHAISATTHEPINSTGELEAARSVLVSFFDALRQRDYQSAVGMYGGPYYHLESMYPNVPSGDHAGLLESVCSEQSTYAFSCWKIKDIVDQKQIGPAKYQFTVRFEDEHGHLLAGGDNRTSTPCLPPEECPKSKYIYSVVNVGGAFLVQELPVCSNCWP